MFRGAKTPLESTAATSATTHWICAGVRSDPTTGTSCVRGVVHATSAQASARVSLMADRE